MVTIVSSKLESLLYQFKNQEIVLESSDSCKTRKIGNYLGKVFLSNRCGYYKITLANSVNKMRAVFLLTNTVIVVSADQVDGGNVLDPYYPTVHGVGFIGSHVGRITKVDGTHTKEYACWRGMLERCYGNRCLSSYEDCIVSEEFHNYSYFCSWINKQKGRYIKDYQVDKDILSDGCKIYAEDTCVLVPSEVNTFFAKSGAKRGKYPIGVSWCEKAKLFVSSYRNGGDCKTSYHKDEWCAFLAYKKAKENRAKELANNWYGQIDDRVYDKLMNYKVLITD